MSALGRCRQTASFRGHDGCPLPDLCSPVPQVPSSRPEVSPLQSLCFILVFSSLRIYNPRPPMGWPTLSQGFRKEREAPFNPPRALVSPLGPWGQAWRGPLHGLSAARLWASGLQSHPSPGTCLRNPPLVSWDQAQATSGVRGVIQPGIPPSQGWNVPTLTRGHLTTSQCGQCPLAPWGPNSILLPPSILLELSLTFCYALFL